MEEKLMDTTALSELLSMPPYSVRKLVNEDPMFPKAVLITPRIRRWKYTEVLEWIDSKHVSRRKLQD